MIPRCICRDQSEWRRVGEARTAPSRSWPGGHLYLVVFCRRCGECWRVPIEDFATRAVPPDVAPGDQAAAATAWVARGRAGV